MDSPVVLQCSALEKTFRSFRRAPGLSGIVRNFVRREYVESPVLRSIDLTIRAGERVGLIGPNGAGKTTLVKCLTGIIPVSSGSARLFGQDSFHLKDEHKRQLALVMGQRSQLWWDLPAIDSFELLREIYQVPRAQFEAKVRDYSRRLEVEDQLQQQLRQLSLGERMKMEIIGAFLHEPKIVFLDEPTIGLDLLSREVIRAFLTEINEKEGATILLTSHDLEDIEDTCRRLVILDAGRIVFDGDLVELHHRIVDQRAIELHFETDLEAGDGWQARLDPLGGQVLEQSARRWRISVPSRNAHATIQLLLGELPVRDLSVERQPLEQLIKDLFRAGRRGA